MERDDRKQEEHEGGQEAAKIKYALRRDYWGQGLASEAVRAMLAWRALRFGLREIIATVAPGNAASQRILLKAGMVRRDTRGNEDGSQTEVFAWSGDPAAPAR